MDKQKIGWRNLSLSALDGHELTSREHLDALAEFREHGAMAGVVFAEPGAVQAATTPEAVEELCERGPESADAVDWTGFDAALEELAEAERAA